MLCIAACLLAAPVAPWPADAATGENCRVCHRDVLTGPHAGIGCSPCHGDDRATVRNPALVADRAARCVACHRGYDRLFDHPMTTRSAERRFVADTLGRADGAFFRNQCGGCHVTGCLDCHPGGGHALTRPRDSQCLSCHRGYFVGTDYHGRAPREDALRYQRGELANGETFLPMLPDVHAEAGMGCADCHSMASLVAGKRTAKGCIDCHTPDPRVVEHRIAAHRDRLECVACHAAWAPQEYGTFWLRFTNSPRLQSRFQVVTRQDDWVKSAYLKRQDAPPLALNEAGRVSPARPQFILYHSDFRNERVVGQENRLLAARWKTFAPHTIRRETVMCDGCHDNPRRFLLEPPHERIYRTRADGLSLDSFWDRTGQRMANGTFMEPERVRRMGVRTPEYTKGYLERWRDLTGDAGGSSRR